MIDAYELAMPYAEWEVMALPLMNVFKVLAGTGVVIKQPYRLGEKLGQALLVDELRPTALTPEDCSVRKQPLRSQT